MVKRDPTEEARVLKNAIKRSIKWGEPLIGNSEEIIKKELWREKELRRLREETIKYSVASARAHKVFQYLFIKGRL